MAKYSALAPCQIKSIGKKKDSEELGKLEVLLTTFAILLEALQSFNY